LPTNWEYYMLCVLLGGVGIGMVIHPAHMVQEGPVWGETLALQAEHVGQNRSKALHTLIVKLCKHM
jgi:hypothetical protein